MIKHPNPIPLMENQPKTKPTLSKIFSSKATISLHNHPNILHLIKSVNKRRFL